MCALKYNLTAFGSEKKETLYSPDCQIVAYTRQSSREYSSFLGQSVHFAVTTDSGKHWETLYHNYGKLFAKCDFSEENGIVSKGVHGIMLYRIKDKYIITGREIRRTNLGTDDFPQQDTGSYVRWTTRDFVTFSDPEICDSRLTETEKSACDNKAVVITPGELDYSEDAVAIGISRATAQKLIENNKTVEFASVELPQSVIVSSREELENIKATVRYTDGSVHSKRIRWNLEGIDFTRAGEYSIDGKIAARHFPFPVEEHLWGDPVLLYHNKKYYFIATNDMNDNKTFEVREADSPEDIFTTDARHSILLTADDGVFTGTFWAPEFHFVGGKLRIFCALSKSGFDPQCHIMTLRDGGDIMNPDDWSDPVRCVMPDGRYLNINPLGDGKNGITLDMTYIEAKGKSYAVWSSRTWEGTDSGSMLFIAEIDPDEPWKLTSVPQLLTRPRYGWENVNGTDNNEGPYAIVTDDKIYLTYSGGSANRDTYVIGLLTANVGDDLCQVSNWEKSISPVLASNFVKGEYGCGHNAFFVDEYGDTYITYHGHDTLESTERIAGIRRVHFTADGTPLFDMSNEQDLPENKMNVKIIVSITAP